MNAAPQLLEAVSSPSDTKLLARLRMSHRMSLERFADLASITSSRMARLTPESISDLDRANLIAASRKEADAYNSYLRAKTKLLSYLVNEHQHHA